ncbi:SMP-30/gluconolaconase/LRE-like protein [Actinomadura pelletieri DSM 43383]|uniref:SMP-30/gluconolaconase/LRE-like protein n=1 Tax=Actinomadura pelletieri DSM 43383 TaxID=1120940 RepID=A0A495QTX4_9ACTN|nr:SMP-30/gluconolactonase/LRE family protein [Actinomadura pelletieri]RKS76881.1 SMP-30/gluconolaconase/LRE-like protein [Actinomadura pelletieri DSM 43383]
MYRAVRRHSLVVAALAAPLLLGSTAQAADAQSRARISTAHVLPGDRVYPEGIAADPRTGDLYVGSYEGGTIFRMKPGQRVAEQFLPPFIDGRSQALGLEVDRSGRLWVADRLTGVAVYDIATRRLHARFTITDQNPRLVNDMAITPDGTAYITGSRRSVVYRITPEQLADAHEQGGDVPLTPTFDLSEVVEPHAPNTITLNGIVAEPSGRYLLTVDMTGGDLYRIALPSGDVEKVALSGGDITTGDGMELHHGTLWVAHPIANAYAIGRWRIGSDGRTARATGRLTDQALQTPTTLLRKHGKLYVVRSQFDKGGPTGPGTPQLPFSIAVVRGF